MFKGCHNPICQKQIKPVASSDGKKAWRRTHRKFCSDQCKQALWALGRVAAMVLVSGQTKVWEALSGLSGGKYIPPLEARNGPRTLMVDSSEPAPVSLDALVRVIKVWDQLKLRGAYK